MSQRLWDIWQSPLMSRLDSLYFFLVLFWNHMPYAFIVALLPLLCAVSRQFSVSPLSHQPVSPLCIQSRVSSSQLPDCLCITSPAPLACCCALPLCTIYLFIYLPFCLLLARVVYCTDWRLVHDHRVSSPDFDFWTLTWSPLWSLYFSRFPVGRKATLLVQTHQTARRVWCREGICML